MTSSADTRRINGWNEKEEVSPRGTGILVLSPLLQPLYVNLPAIMLLRDLAQVPPETLNPTDHIVVLPPILVDLAGKILSVLRQNDASSDHGYCEMRCLTEHAQKEVLIRGIGLPSGNGGEKSRVVFVFTERDEWAGTGSLRGIS